MKAQIVTVVLLAFTAACLAIPRNKRQTYDEPRLSNEVIPGVLQVADETSQEVITTDEAETSSVQIDTTKAPALDDAPTARPGHKKRKPTDAVVPVSGFSRVIDDIFNIPISVLRAVNTLLSNAFGTKQVTATASSTATVEATAA